MKAGAPLYVVVNSLLDSRFDKKTGIPRVEYEIAKYLTARGAQAIAWQRSRFVSVDFASEIEALTNALDQDLDVVCDEPTRPSPMPRWRLALARLLEPLAKRSPKWLNLSGAVNRLLAGEWPRLTPAERRTVTVDFSIVRDSKRQARFLVAHSMPSQAFSLRRKQADFQPNGLILLMGTFWSDWPFQVIERLKASHDMRLVVLMYDLIPLRRPELFADATGCARFKRHLDFVLKLSDATAAISDFVARDIEAYARESNVATRPVTAVPLCTDLTTTRPAHSARLRNTGLQPGRFVVYVSSLNTRKNHHFAYQLWRKAVEEMGDAVPTLVFAGQKGWGVGDSLAIMSRDELVWPRKLMLFESPTDAEIAWLYANCAFTILPSITEGWGLPITESLSFGRYCLAAANSSLPEAGQGLAFHADTLDGAAWLAEIRRLVTERGYLEQMNARVAAGFRRRSWADVAGEIHALVEGARAAPSIEAMRGGAQADTVATQSATSRAVSSQVRGR